LNTWVTNQICRRSSAAIAGSASEQPVGLENISKYRQHCFSRRSENSKMKKDKDIFSVATTLNKDLVEEVIRLSELHHRN
jgi:hypothetical protein